MRIDLAVMVGEVLGRKIPAIDDFIAVSYTILTATTVWLGLVVGALGR